MYYSEKFMNPGRERPQSTTSAHRNHKRKRTHSATRRTHDPRSSHPTSASRQTNNTVAFATNRDNTSTSIQLIPPDVNNTRVTIVADVYA